MKRLKFNYTKHDKYNKKIVYEKYDENKKGPIYTFEDERADEILAARTKVTNEPIAEEYIEEEVEEAEEIVEAKEIPIADVLEEVIEEEKPKRGRKKNTDN